MALTKCKECKKKISSKAESCPHCGCPNKPEQTKISSKPIKGGGCLFVIIIFIVPVIIYNIEYDSHYSKSNTDSNSIEATSSNPPQIIKTPQQKEAYKNQILNKLKTIPVKEYEQNRALYEELAQIYPGDKLFQKKLKFYQTKINEQAARRLAEENRQKRIEKGFSSWDGSHYSLTKYIKRTMHDPDSYDHVETKYWDYGKHLRIRTTFRGKNAFGGIVKNSMLAKVDLDGNIIEILDSF